MTEACIVGWAHSPFGKLDDPDIESLIGRVAGAAIADAGIAPREIEGSILLPADCPCSCYQQRPKYPQSNLHMRSNRTYFGDMP